MLIPFKGVIKIYCLLQIWLLPSTALNVVKLHALNVREQEIRHRVFSKKCDTHHRRFLLTWSSAETFWLPVFRRLTICLSVNVFTFSSPKSLGQFQPNLASLFQPTLARQFQPNLTHDILGYRVFNEMKCNVYFQWEIITKQRKYIDEI